MVFRLMNVALLHATPFVKVLFPIQHSMQLVPVIGLDIRFPLIAHSPDRGEPVHTFDLLA